jgi:dipeptidyl aminopeptidase/acylaminoacyl peptidase
MRTRQIAAALVLVLGVSALLVAQERLAAPIEERPSATPIARQALPSDSPLRALDCTTPVALPEKIDRLLGLSLSPDGRVMAVARDLDPNSFSRALVKRPVDPALKHIQLVDLGSLRIVDDIGAGVGPLWSGSGRYLSYHVPQGSGEQVATELVVFDTTVRREIARLQNIDVGSAEASWDGDALVYLDGADVHRWEPTGDRIMSTISAAYLPPAGLPVLSADGRALANAIGLDGTAPVNAFVIEAATGQATTLTAVRSLAWSRAGHRLLVSYDDHRELIEEDGSVRRADVPFVSTSVQWSPDGRQPLFADPVPPSAATYPATRTFTDFDARPTGITIPSAVSGSFDRDGRRVIGRWFDGYFPPELRVYNCTAV